MVFDIPALVVAELENTLVNPFVLFWREIKGSTASGTVERFDKRI